MPRRPRDSRIETREARRRLEPRREPYWRSIRRGLFVGYYRGADGIGSWHVRVYDPERRRDRWARLGGADDFVDADGRDVLSYDQAVELALRRAPEVLARLDAPARAGERRAGPFTVDDALDAYLAWYAKHRKAVAATRSAVEAHIRPVLGPVPVAKLTAARIRRWHEELAAAPRRRRTGIGREQRVELVDADDVDAVRARKSTANRVLTILRAALNRAFEDGKVHSDLEWRRVQPFAEVDAPREQYLSEDDARRLLNACDPDFRRLVEAALLTGCRYGELAAARVRDYQPEARTLRVPRSKGGRPRVVHLTDEGGALLDELTAGRPATAHVFTHADGTAWGKSHQARPMAQACAVAKIEPPVTFHGLRDTFASWLAIRGVPLQFIAQALGHADTRITERHYAHLQPSHVGEAVRANLPKLRESRRTVDRVSRLHRSRPEVR